MSFEMIGIGSALVDVTIMVDDSFLEKEGLAKGGMTLIDSDRSKSYLNHFPLSSQQLSSGGASANVSVSFAHCGGKSAFIGKVGPDDMGSYFKRDMNESGVSFLELTSQNPTGVVLSFITPDGERTFATHLGASVELSPDDLPESFLNQAPLVHIEGYLVFNRPLMDYVVKIARKVGQKISIDLASYNVVEENKDYFESIFSGDVEVLFANEEEAKAYSGLAAKDALSAMKNTSRVTVVKEGSKGSYVHIDDNEHLIDAFNVDLVDTNGAGDAYAGGFLYGLSKQLEVGHVGKIASKAGSLIVSQRAARLSDINAKALRRFVESV